MENREVSLIEKNQIFYIKEAYFLLPDDFSGNEEDALEFYLKHLQEKQRDNSIKSIEECRPDEFKNICQHITPFEYFLMALRGGFKSCTVSSILKLSKKDLE